MKLELRDIHLPDSDMLWWPLAMGWYVLIILLVLGVVLVFFWKKRKPKAVVIDAGVAMQGVYLAYLEHENQHQFMQDLSIMMRRICLRYFPTQQVAALQGKAWVDFLDRSTEGQVCFSSGMGQSLEAGPYNKKQDVDVKALYDICQTWLKVIEKNAC